MKFHICDFNGADSYFGAQGAGAQEWVSMDRVLQDVDLHLKASDQKGIQGSAIFDPVATNASLTRTAEAEGWHKIPMPESLKSFGLDWDAGKGVVLAEWQFSNYPFLWNNATRTELASRGKTPLRGLDGPAEALIVVTKSSVFPSSQSTLYFEQARAQLQAVTSLNIFETPMRLVGLALDMDQPHVDAVWTEYAARYQRNVVGQKRKFAVLKSPRKSMYGVSRASFQLL